MRIFHIDSTSLYEIVLFEGILVVVVVKINGFLITGSVTPYLLRIVDEPEEDRPKMRRIQNAELDPPRKHLHELSASN
jgi:hypothetical protein